MWKRRRKARMPLPQVNVPVYLRLVDEENRVLVNKYMGTRLIQPGDRIDVTLPLDGNGRPVLIWL